MNRILLFGGTAEGRRLTEWCEENKIFVTVCVATEYGYSLLRESEYVNIILGRKNKQEIVSLIEQNNYAMVIDATHPYAIEVTQNINAACEITGLSYYRVIREDTPTNYGIYFNSLDEIISWLNGNGQRSGKILVTTGSSCIRALAKLDDYTKRCVIRFLPDENIERECLKIGYDKRQMIMAKGPFSVERNCEHIRRFGVKYLITKDSGDAGGFLQKIDAAKICGILPLIIRRPTEEGYTLEAVKQKILNSDSLKTDVSNAEKKYKTQCKEEIKKQVAIVGIGMDGVETLTKQGMEVIEKAQVLIGAKRMLAPFSYMKKIQFKCHDSEKIKEYIQQSDKQSFAVLMSGDSGFYSGTKNLMPLMEGFDMSVISGISSPSYFAGRLNMPWQDWCIKSLHGVHINTACTVSSHFHTFFLLGGDISSAKLCAHLTEYGLGDVKVFIGENLCSDKENIYTDYAKKLQNLQTDRLSVILIENEKYENGVKRGIPDEMFIRGSVPMTKEEVRSVVLSKLNVKETDICWDIGSGTGSVSVEMALSCKDGMVYAVEKNPDAVALSKENFIKFHCDNIVIHEGEAKDLSKELPVPDCVFVGGSSSQLRPVVECAFSKNPNVRFVVTAVSIETLNETVETLHQIGHEARMTQIAVTRTKKRGSHTMFEGQNPVMIIETV